jgi:succinate-semialdehyde dehydrogenase/glutarate-semialdehyde dehydrogenase
VCSNRFYVQAGVYDQFVEKFAAKVRTAKVGNGFEEGVNQGPLIEEAALEKVQRHVDDAVAKGARVVVGGKRLNHGFGPVFRTHRGGRCHRRHAVRTRRNLWPVCAGVQVPTEQEAIDAANATEFGLASYFYSRDIGRIYRVAEALEYGMVGINVGILATEHVPFGGVKQSGLGREGSATLAWTTMWRSSTCALPCNSPGRALRAWTGTAGHRRL